MTIFKKMQIAWKVFNGELAAVPSKFEVDDLPTGERWRISTSDRYTRIAVGPREYFFTRDGKYDGTGFAFCGDGIEESIEA